MASKNPFINYIVIFISCFVLYGNTLNHDFVLDDEVVYLKNQYVQDGLKGIPDIFSHGFLHGFNQRNDQSYRPLVLVNFAIEHQLFGNNPKVHHFFNIIYYGLACSLLYLMLSILFKEQKNWLAFWITILFLAHPIHTEVVANIKGRDELLHLILYLTSLIYLFKYIDYRKVKQLVLALLALFLACISKEMAITALLVAPLAIYTFRDLSSSELFRLSGLLLVPVSVYLFIRYSILDTVTFEEQMNVINNSIAASENGSEQFASTLYIFANYLKLFFWPHPLSWDYSFPHFQTHQLNEPLITLLLVSLIALVFIALWRLYQYKCKISFGFLFFLISFSIVSNFFILIGSTLGERFLFTPSIGLLISLAFIILAFFEKFQQNPSKQKRGFISLIAVLLVFMSFKTIDRNADWKNSRTLFSAGIEATPNNSRAVSAYASIYREIAETDLNPQVKQENFQLAIKWYKKSLELYPEVAEVWYNLGVSYMGIGRNDLAKNCFLESIKYDRLSLTARNNLGVIHFQNQEFDQAKKYFEECLAINPEFQSAYANLGAVFHNLGEFQKAKDNYERALQLNPQDQNTLANYNKLIN